MGVEMIQLDGPFTVAIPVTVHPGFAYVVGVCIPALSDLITADDLQRLQRALPGGAVVYRRNDGGISIQLRVNTQLRQPLDAQFQQAGTDLHQIFAEVTGIRSAMQRCAARDLPELLQ